MFDKLTKLQQKAIAPYSHYKVACIVTTDLGEFEGFNIESAVYPLSMCAERNAIANALIHGAKKFNELYLITDSINDLGTPCGSCRQLIFENFNNPNATIYVFSKIGKEKKYLIKELLPYGFSNESFNKN